MICAGEIGVGVVGTAIHIALHQPPSLLSLATEPRVWLDVPPPLVPLSFAAAGCLGFIPVALPGQRKLSAPPVAIARILEALAALCGLIAAVAGAQAGGGTVGLIAVIAALGLGSFGFIAELLARGYAFVRGQAT